MKVATRLFVFLGLFYIPVGTVYGLMTDWKEPLGYLALFLTSLMALMIAAYLRYTAGHIDALPEDDHLGEIAHGRRRVRAVPALFVVAAGSRLRRGAARCGAGGRVVAVLHRPAGHPARHRGLGVRVPPG